MPITDYLEKYRKPIYEFLKIKARGKSKTAEQVAKEVGIPVSDAYRCLNAFPEFKFTGQGHYTYGEKRELNLTIPPGELEEMIASTPEEPPSAKPQRR